MYYFDVGSLQFPVVVGVDPLCFYTAACNRRGSSYGLAEVSF